MTTNSWSRLAFSVAALAGLAVAAVVLFAPSAEAQGWGCGTTPRTGSGANMNNDAAGDYTGPYGIAADWCRAGVYDNGVNLYNVFTMNTATTPTAAEHALGTQYRAFFGVGTTGPAGGQGGTCWDTRLDWATTGFFTGTLLANQGCQLVNNGAAAPGSFSGVVYCNEIHAIIPLTSLGIVPPGTGQTIEYGMWLGTTGNGFYVFPWGTYQPGTNTVLDNVAGTPNRVYTLGAPFNLYQPEPTGVTATATGDNTVTVSWTAPTQSAEAQQIRWYRVYRSDNGGPFNFLGQTAGPGTSYADNTFAAQDATSTLSTYEYKVSSVNCNQLPVQAGANVGGESVLSAVSNAVTPDFRPDAPALDAITTYGSASVTLTWTAPADKPAGGTGVQEYRVYRSTTSPVTTTGPPVCTVAAPVLTCDDLSVSPSTTYFYAVEAADGFAGGPNIGALSNQRSIKTLAAEVPALGTLSALTVYEGYGKAITDEANLKYTFSGGPTQVEYELVSLPTKGVLKLNGVDILSTGQNKFTQDDINGDLVSYVHDGSETTADSFVFIAREPSGGGAMQKTFSIIVVPVNDQPSMAPVSPVTAYEDGGLVSLTIGTGLSVGPAPESGTQTLTTSVVSATNGAMFLVAPTFTADGKLTFQTKPDEFGVSTVVVRLKDSGGVIVDNGITYGSDQRDYTIALDVKNVNDEPDFTLALPLVYADWDWTLAEATVPAFFDLVTFGPKEDTGPGAQAIQSITLSGYDAALFDVAPTIDPVTYDLVFDPKMQTGLAPGTEPQTTVTVTLKDNGGTDPNGAGDDSKSLTFIIRLREPNIPPEARDDAFDVWRNVFDVQLDVLGNDTDPNTPPDPLTVTAITPVLDVDDGVTVRGAAVWDPVTKTILFTPVTGSAWQGVATFTYTIFDGREPDGYATATVTLTIQDPEQAQVLFHAPSPACMDTPLALWASGHFIGDQPTYDGFPDAWEWDLGDGSDPLSTGAGWRSDVVHAYAEPGLYTLTIMADFDGDVVTEDFQLQVNECIPPVPTFTYTARGREVEFSAVDAAGWTYSWDFGDLQSGSGSHVFHTYAGSGIYTVTLAVIDDEGLPGSVTLPVTVPASMGTVDPFPTGGSQELDPVRPAPPTPPAPPVTPPTPNLPPVADAGPDMQVPGGALVYLDGSDSFDPDGQVLGFTWRQVDGPLVELNGATDARPWFVAPYGRSVTFTLSVTDGIAVRQDAVTVTASSAPTAVDWLARPDGPYVQFEPLDAPAGASFLWSFGDGQTSTERSPLHLYDEPAAYQVTLTVTDGSGDRQTTRLVTVAFSEAPDVGEPVEDTQADASSAVPAMPFVVLASLVVLLAVVVATIIYVVRRRA